MPLKQYLYKCNKPQLTEISIQQHQYNNLASMQENTQLSLTSQNKRKCKNPQWCHVPKLQNALVTQQINFIVAASNGITHPNTTTMTDITDKDMQDVGHILSCLGTKQLFDGQDEETMDFTMTVDTETVEDLTTGNTPGEDN